jgi:CHAT domain-containing protein
MNNGPHKIHLRLDALCAILFFSVSSLHAQNVHEVESMNNQVLALLNQGQYTQSMALALKALKLSEDSLGSEHPTTADSLNNLGGLYETLGDYAKAEPLFLRALKIREKALGPEHQFTARNLGNLGVLYLKMGQNAKAEPLLQRAVTINEKVLGPDSSATATMVGSLGTLYLNMGDYAKAELFMQRALKTFEKTSGPEDPQTATCLGNLAGVYWHVGDYAKAEPLLQRVLVIREKVRGADHPETAKTLQHLATFYYSMGDFAKSEAFYQRALRIQEARPGPEHPDTADTLAGMALLYMRMGDSSKAEPILTRALRIQEKSLGPEHPATAQSLSKLAELYDKTADYAKVEPLYLRVLQIQERRLGPEHPDVAGTLLNLGAFSMKVRNFEKAELFTQRALRIVEKVLGPEHPTLAPCLNNLAAIYVKMGNYSNAVPLFERALRIDEKIFGPNHPDTLVHLNNLGLVYFDQKKRDEALQIAERAERARLGMFANVLSFASEQQRLVYQAQDRPYSLFACLDSVRQLTLTLFRSKGIVLDSLLEDRLVAEASQNPQDRAIIEELGPAKQRLTQLLLQTPKDFSKEALNHRAKTRDRLAREVEQLEGTLAQKVAGLGHARRALSVTVEQVQKAVTGKAALIEFFRYPHYLGTAKWETRYGAVALTSSGDPKWICLESAALIEENIGRIQELVRNKTSEPELTTRLKGLYRQIWAPLEPILPAGSKTIVISPDAGLNFVSFATLLTTENQFLAEKYSICYVASGRDLLHEQNSLTNTEMVVFGDPDYTGGRRSSWSGSDVDLRPLPGTATEATTLEVQARKWSWPTQVYLGTNATEIQFRTVRSPHILHVATHGFFLPETVAGMNRSSYSVLNPDPNGLQNYVVLRNPMLRSGIALAGAQITLDAWKRGEVPPTDQDGIITAEEVGSLDLKGTWLVTLSACDTGIGKLSAGEGVMGLRRGFIQAGAQNLLMSLWPVLDRATSEFMLDFYSSVQKSGNPPEALASVQRNWLVNLRKKQGLLVAVIVAGSFILSFQGPLQSN